MKDENKTKEQLINELTEMRKRITELERLGTERKRAEEGLLHERELLDTLMNNIPDSIYFKDNKSRFIRINKAQAEALGISNPHQAIGKTDFDFFAEEHAKQAYEDEQEIIKIGRPLIGKIEQDIRPDGWTRWVSTTKVPIVDKKGRANGIVGISRDITERKWVEAKLKQTLAELERSNAELEQFAYVTSHDLQEPLRMVFSYVQLLEQRYKGRLDSDADEFIAYAVDGAIRMQEMINDLLDYSRVSTRGKSFEPTDCEAVFDRTLANLRVAIEENGAVVTHDPLPTVMADKVQLVQLFQNLIGNAIKFRGEKPLRVYVSAEQKGNEWVFSVCDNGIGIDLEYAGRIFRVFQRLHSKTEYPGTGIGLAICKKIVERHGGRIWVESQPREGSTFYFTIPTKE